VIDICNSGGSKGADDVFGKCAKYVKHQVRHFSFPGHSSPCLKEDLIPLNMLQLSEADTWLLKANELLHRKYPTNSIYVDNLLQRNFYQINESKRIYAISAIEKSGHVEGGTGWAVAMGMLYGIEEIFVFDVKKDHWFELDIFDEINNKVTWKPLRYIPPYPCDKYAGIGKHDLPKNGEKAIYELYTLLT